MKQMPQQLIIAMTGASGAAYGLRLIERLAAQQMRLHLLFSDAARVVLQQETALSLPDEPAEQVAILARHLDIDAAGLHAYALRDWFSPAASGSARIRHMVIAPCSMGTLARIAHGMSDNLIERAADVQIKERGQLIVVPRETPLSAIHLENMLTLARMGADIIPAMPGYYHRPQRIEELVDFIVDRIIDHLNADNPEAARWGA